MYTASVSRREFLDILQRSYPGTPLSRTRDERDYDLKGEDLQLVWKDERQCRDYVLPSMVVIPAGGQKDFFAWAFTYLATLRPFTAFIRVVEPSLFQSITRTESQRNLARVSEAFIALIIGEATSYVEPRLDLRQLTSNACANTHSYALTRATVLGLGEFSEHVSIAWASLGELTRQTRRHFDLASLRAPFQVLFELLTGRSGPTLTPPNDLVRQACGELLKSGDINDRTWRELSDTLGGLFELRAQMQESRENRVRTLERASEWFADHRRAEPLLSAFVCGYLCSRIAPGDLDHLNLVSRFLPNTPAAMLWFSVCSGLQSHGQVSAFADGLGSRILRDLEQSEDLFGRPRCDIALAELELLSMRDKPLTDFRTSSNGMLTVELIPAVTTSIRWQRTAEVQVDLFERRDSSADVRNLVRELSFALERVEIIRRQLARHADLDPDNPTQSKGEKKARRR